QQRILIPREPHVVLAGELYVFRAGYVLGEIPAVARREERVARPLKNERRDADGGKHASHVEIEPPTENARARCGWHRQDAIAREPREEGGIARQVRTRERHALIVLPLPSFGDEGNRLIHELSRKSSRVVFAPSGARPSFRDRERGRSLGIRRRE